MRDLIKINDDGKITARELYEFLRLDWSNWARWAKTNIEQNEFYQETVDWRAFVIMTNGNETKDYELTIEFAKHLCMLSRSDQGKKARDYFVEVEKRWKRQSLFEIPKTFAEALRLAADLSEKNEALRLDVAQSKQIIGELQPKASYYDLVLQNSSVVPITLIAKDYGFSAYELNELLHELGVQYKMAKTWVLYQHHAEQGYTQTKTHVIDADRNKMHTYWTQKGRLFIYDLLKNKKGILPRIERDEPVQGEMNFEEGNP